MERQKILTNTDGFDLFLRGKKTATSRYGDRRKDFEIGKVYDFECNDGSGRKVQVLVTGFTYQLLIDMTRDDAKAVGCESVRHALIEFVSIYTKLGYNVNAQTYMTIVYLKRVYLKQGATP